MGKHSTNLATLDDVSGQERAEELAAVRSRGRHHRPAKPSVPALMVVETPVFDDDESEDGEAEDAMLPEATAPDTGIEEAASATAAAWHAESDARVFSGTGHSARTDASPYGGTADAGIAQTAPLPQEQPASETQPDATDAGTSDAEFQLLEALMAAVTACQQAAAAIAAAQMPDGSQTQALGDYETARETPSPAPAAQMPAPAETPAATKEQARAVAPATKEATATGGFPRSRTLEDVADFILDMRFRTRIIGGVDETDVWKQIDELRKEYEAVFLAQELRHEADMKGKENGNGPERR